MSTIGVASLCESAWLVVAASPLCELLCKSSSNFLPFPFPFEALPPSFGRPAFTGLEPAKAKVFYL